MADRRASDSDYDPRHPRKSHADARPQPSYYGPNFQNSAKGRSSSFTNILQPKMPDPYVKRPQPYPPKMAKEHDHYKELQGALPPATQAYNRVDPMHAGKNDDDREKKWRQGIELGKRVITVANEQAAGRSGFDHKYPYAFESPREKDTHARIEVNHVLRTSRKYRK